MAFVWFVLFWCFWLTGCLCCWSRMFVLWWVWCLLGCVGVFNSVVDYILLCMFCLYLRWCFLYFVLWLLLFLVCCCFNLFVCLLLGCFVCFVLLLDTGDLIVLLGAWYTFALRLVCSFKLFALCVCVVLFCWGMLDVVCVCLIIVMIFALRCCCSLYLLWCLFGWLFIVTVGF